MYLYDSPFPPSVSVTQALVGRLETGPVRRPVGGKRLELSLVGVVKLGNGCLWIRLQVLSVSWVGSTCWLLCKSSFPFKGQKGMGTKCA